MLDDAADVAPRRAGTKGPVPVLEEVLADAVEHSLHRLVQHAVAQELVVSDLQQDDVRLKVAVGRDDDRAFPIHEGQILFRVAHAGGKDLVNLGLVEHFSLGTQEFCQTARVAVDPFFGRRPHLLHEQDNVFLEQPVLPELRRDEARLQRVLQLLEFLERGSRKRVILFKMEFDDLNLSVVTLSQDRNPLALNLERLFGERVERDVHRLEVGRVLQSVDRLRGRCLTVCRIGKGEQVSQFHEGGCCEIGDGRYVLRVACSVFTCVPVYLYTCLRYSRTKCGNSPNGISRDISTKPAYSPFLYQGDW